MTGATDIHCPGPDAHADVGGAFAAAARAARLACAAAAVVGAMKLAAGGPTYVVWSQRAATGTAIEAAANVVRLAHLAVAAALLAAGVAALARPPAAGPWVAGAALAWAAAVLAELAVVACRAWQYPKALRQWNVLLDLSSYVDAAARGVAHLALALLIAWLVTRPGATVEGAARE